MTPYLDIFHAALVPEHDFQNKYYSKQLLSSLAFKIFQ